MTQGGYQVIVILPIKSKMAAAKKRCFLRFPYLTDKVSLWYVALLINAKCCLFILE